MAKQREQKFKRKHGERLKFVVPPGVLTQEVTITLTKGKRGNKILSVATTDGVQIETLPAMEIVQ